ncbi:MAG TPA: hypothetical protein VET65_00865 [Candidatus Limnocylindrales bacterium]|nr:hypothetical protein [Candidatus Limnocylindrales bacterium]
MSPLARLNAGLRLGLLLWRAQMRMLWNHTIRSRKPLYLVGVVLAAVTVIVWWIQVAFLSAVAATAASRVHTGVPLDRLLGLVFIGYTAFLIFSSFLFTLNALLVNVDLELLLPAPWPIEAVVIGRMVAQGLRLLVISLLVTLPAVILLPVFLGHPLAALGLLAIIAIYPVIPLVLVTLVTLVAIRLVPPGRGREVITALSLLVALGINLVNILANPALQGRAPRLHGGFPDIPVAASPVLPFGWAARASAAGLEGDLARMLAWILVLLLASAAALVIGVRVSGAIYVAGWIQGAQGRGRRRRPAGARGAIHIPGLTPVVTALIVKDWRLRLRDLTQLARFVMPMVFLIVLVVLRAGPLFRLVHALGPGPIAALLALGPAWLVLLAITSAFGLSAVSLEGQAMWIYLASPNGMREFLEAKCWSVVLPALALSMLVGIALEVLVHPGTAWAVATLALLPIAGVGLGSLMVAIGALWARFDWTDTRRMVHPAGGLLGSVAQMVASGAIALLGVGAAFFARPLGLPQWPTFVLALALPCAALLAVSLAALILAAQRLRLLQL